MTYRIIKGLIRFIIIIKRINWFQFYKLYDKQSESVIWIQSKGFNYFIGDAIIWDFATINALVRSNTMFRIYYGSNTEILTNKKIFHTINRGVVLKNLNNYVDSYMYVISKLESQNNILIPSTYEVNYWENKGYMHQQFKIMNVHEPDTQLYTFEKFRQINFSNFTYPFLIKSEHAHSAKGITKIDNESALQKLISSEKFIRENKIIIKQELINMRRDLRVILVGNEIVHFYWRINKSKEWKPTSTSFGSDVDFENFPERWRTHILDTFKMLNITTGAFDITWQDDDLNNLPLYLEVSPVFQPNPKIELKGKEYAYYKKSFSIFNAYDNKFVDLIFKIKQKQINFIQKK